MTISALVLAAGASRRLGRPKALVLLDGRPALARIVDVLRSAGLTSGVVVAGAHAAALRAGVDPAPFVFVDNPDPDAGRTGSVQCGLRALPPGDDVLLWPVDRPLAPVAVVRALLAARAEDPAGDRGSVVPRAAGRRGHPVLLAAALRPALLAAPPDASLRDVLRAAGGTVRDVDAGDESLHFDLDTEEDVARANAWLEARKR